MKKITNERKEILLNELLEYRYEKENNIKALNILKEKLSILQTQYKNNGHTVAYQNERIKEENSFLNKINNNLDKNKDLTYESMHDIVGVRLVCLTLSDAKEVFNLIQNSDEFKVIEFKNYVEKKDEPGFYGPKQSGYMGYHVIVDVPIQTASGTKYIKSEIQIRTIFMDIFAREEHKLSYKGKASEKDKKELLMLSNKLYFYDNAIDNLFKIDNPKVKEDRIEDLSLCIQEFDKISYLYGNVYDLLKERITKFVNEYHNSGDVLHITSRIKPVSSIKRKLINKQLTCSAENILYNIRDVVGFKIVCVDENVAKDFIKDFKNYIDSLERIEITEVNNNLDDPKESGYRGYKMNISYSMPTLTGNQPITTEILIRTMVMDAWALHDDKLFNTETDESTKKQLTGLSHALHDVEEKLLDLKTNVQTESKQPDLVKIIEEYQLEKRKKNIKKLEFINETKKD